MPYRAWKHVCPDGLTILAGTPEPHACSNCGGTHFVYDGWRCSMFEAMAQYARTYRLKPIGPHRPFADRLFAKSTRPCDMCDGRGVIGSDDSVTCRTCDACRGRGSHWIIVPDEVERRHQAVLEAYPDAGVKERTGNATGTE